MSSFLLLLMNVLSLFAVMNIVVLVKAYDSISIMDKAPSNYHPDALSASNGTRMRLRSQQVKGDEEEEERRSGRYASQISSNSTLPTGIGSIAPLTAKHEAGDNVLEAFLTQSLQNLNTMQFVMDTERELNHKEDHRIISKETSDSQNSDWRQSSTRRSDATTILMPNSTSPASLISSTGIWEEDLDMQIELERRLSADRYGWRKFNVVVGYANPLKIPDQTPLAAGDLYVADEYVFNTKQNDNIGRMYQRCILMPIEPANALLSVWECVWEFDLKLKSAQPGKLALQGPWFFDEVGFFDLQSGVVNPLFPSKQYVVINGGTGAFTGVYGVARIKPLDLLAIPPSVCYTFYLQLG